MSDVGAGLLSTNAVSRTGARLGAILGVCACLCAPAFGQEGAWPQFRGPVANPVADHPGLPSTWSTTENVEWVTEVPGIGWSSPVVWGNRVFVTSTTSEKPLKQPSLGVDFSNDYVAELMKEGKTEEEVEELVTARDMELPGEVRPDGKVVPRE